MSMLINIWCYFDNSCLSCTVSVKVQHIFKKIEHFEKAKDQSIRFLKHPTTGCYNFFFQFSKDEWLMSLSMLRHGHDADIFPLKTAFL